jgi:hypothetical protein
MRVVIGIQVVVRVEVTMRVLMQAGFVHEYPPQQSLRGLLKIAIILSSFATGCNDKPAGTGVRKAAISSPI